MVPRHAIRSLRRLEPVHPVRDLHAGPRVLGDVSQRVDGRVRLAGADLEENVAPRDIGLQIVVRERGHLGQPFGFLVGQPEGGVLEQAGAESDRDRQPVGWNVGAERATVGRGCDRAEIGRNTAVGEEPGPLSQRLEGADQRTARVGGGVEDREACSGRRCVGDPRLVATVKGDRREPCGRVADDCLLHGAVGQKRIGRVTRGVAASVLRRCPRDPRCAQRPGGADRGSARAG
jgi:hypothetical protein